MDLRLSGKTALVTGSTAGIGAAIARLLAAEGAIVIVHGRNAPKAAAISRGIAGSGGSAAYVIGDLRTDATAAEVFQRGEDQAGPIDILVNNAGTYGTRPWMETTADTWRDYFEADVLSAVRLALLAVPGMTRRGWGRIIQVGTDMATSPRPEMADYAAAKAALANMTVSLAKALAGTGVTSNTVSPGLIQTEGVDLVLSAHALRAGWDSDPATIQQRWLEEVLGARYTRRLGTPEDVAALVAFVASPLAGYVNGANLRIDGGLSVSVN